MPEAEYGSALLVRRVQEHGEFSWKHDHEFLSEVLWGERIGLQPIDERYYRVDLAWLPIARFDSHQLRIERLPDQDGEERRPLGGGNDGNPNRWDFHIPATSDDDE